MPKIKVEIEVPSGEYCENDDTSCSMRLKGNWGKYYCALFGDDLEMDANNDYYCKRCNKCKQAEVKDEKEL